MEKCGAEVHNSRCIVSTFAYAHYQVFFENLQRLLGRADCGSPREHFSILCIHVGVLGAEPLGERVGRNV